MTSDGGNGVTPGQNYVLIGKNIFHDDQNANSCFTCSVLNHD